MIEPASVYLELREAITRLVPGEHGLAPTAELPHVWGAMVDVGLPPGPVTVVAIADGTTSLYLGNGGATVGAEEVPTVAVAARRLLVALDASLGQLRPTWRFPVPGPGTVQVLALTYGGMLGAWADLDELPAGDHPLSGVFALVGEVVAAIERLDARAGG